MKIEKPLTEDFEFAIVNGSQKRGLKFMNLFECLKNLSHTKF